MFGKIGKRVNRNMRLQIRCIHQAEQLFEHAHRSNCINTIYRRASPIGARAYASLLLAALARALGRLGNVGGVRAAVHTSALACAVGIRERQLRYV